jgi:hypothetical protein
LAKEQSIVDIYRETEALSNLESQEINLDIVMKFDENRQSLLNSINEATNLGMTRDDIIKGIEKLPDRQVLSRINYLFNPDIQATWEVGDRFMQLYRLGNVVDSFRNLENIEETYRSLPPDIEKMVLDISLQHQREGRVIEQFVESRENLFQQRYQEAHEALDESIRIAREFKAPLGIFNLDISHSNTNPLFASTKSALHNGGNPTTHLWYSQAGNTGNQVTTSSANWKNFYLKPVAGNISKNQQLFVQALWDIIKRIK